MPGPRGGGSGTGTLGGGVAVARGGVWSRCRGLGGEGGPRSEHLGNELDELADSHYVCCQNMQPRALLVQMSTIFKSVFGRNQKRWELEVHMSSADDPLWFKQLRDQCVVAPLPFSVV